MIVVFCVEKDQSKEISIAFLINEFKDNIEDYFDKASFGNYQVNIKEFLVESWDSSSGIAYAFELPDTVLLHPPIGQFGFDTSFVVQPWMVNNILAQADNLYDFNEFDTDADAIVDYVGFMLIKFRVEGWATGTTGLSIDDFYETNDTTSNGTTIKIDGNGYLNGGGDSRAIILRRNANPENLTTIAIHEMGHSLFDFPDMGGSSFHYGLGQFCPMAGGGFNGRASLYDPVLRITNGWVTLNELSNNTTITFSDFDLSGESYYYEMPYYQAGIYPWFSTRPDQKIHLTYYSKPITNRWQQFWPIPKSLQEESRGVLIWHSSPYGTFTGSRSRQDMPIDIESAHGRWDWVIDYADSLDPPNDRRAIRSSNQNPLTGLDSLEVRYSYRWKKYEEGGYIDMSTYPDGRIGSASCFFDPLNPQKFSLSSNPTSNTTSSDIQIGYGRFTPSGFSFDNLRLESGDVKADIIVGNQANTITENTILTKGIWVMISDIYVASNATLTIPPGTKLIFYNGSSLTINGTLSAQGNSSEHIFFDFIDDQSDGIVVGNGGSIDLDYCEIKNGTYGVNTFHTFNSIFISDCTFENISDYGLFISGTTSSIPHIVDCSFTDVQTAIGVANIDEIIIKGNQITDSEMGIYVSNVSTPHLLSNTLTSTLDLNAGIFLESSNGIIRNNFISGHTSGIHLGNSSPDIGDNEITDNLDHGIYVGAGSLPNLEGELFSDPPVYYPLTGYNNIYDNGGTTSSSRDGSEIYISNANADLHDGCNSIVDDRVETEILINTKFLLSGESVGMPIVVKADNNFWGSHPVYQLSERFNGLVVHYQPYYSQPCPIPQGGGGGGEEMMITSSEGEVLDTLFSIEKEIGSPSQTELLYAAANEKFITADYNSAKQIYNQIVNSNDTLYSKLNAYQKLYQIGKLTNENSAYFESLRTEYNNLVTAVSDSLLVKVFSQLSSLSSIAKEDYETAIDDFESIIQQNPQSEEAVYAEIDALTTALLVENGDTTLGKRFGGKFLVENNREYGRRVNDLLKSKFGSSEQKTETVVVPEQYNLYQNYPNPFNPITTIKYDLPKSGNVELVIFDILGRKIKTLISQVQEPGRYEVKWDASNAASGIYIYQLKTDNFIKSRKMILLK